MWQDTTRRPEQVLMLDVSPVVKIELSGVRRFIFWNTSLDAIAKGLAKQAGALGRKAARLASCAQKRTLYDKLLRINISTGCPAAKQGPGFLYTPPRFWYTTDRRCIRRKRATIRTFLR
jgi:hypothetical protein